MSIKAIIRRILKLENDMYGTNGSGVKALSLSLKSSFKMLKFMFCAMLTLQVVMISILMLCLTAGR